MVRTLIKYPDPTIRLISANVRFFNDELHQWITDIIDTMKENDLDALSAIMIGIQYNIIVIKEEEGYHPFINSRLIKHTGNATATERSVYYEGISVDVDRYETVTAVYEDENGESHHREFSGEAARMFQQQLDYCFGSTFVDRVDKEMKQRINDYLAYGLVADGGSCPTVFYRDRFKLGAKYLISGVAISLITPFFVPNPIREWIYRIDIAALIAIMGLVIVYFFYAQYESRIYKQCTSCQTGNIIGTVAILIFQVLIISCGVFFWLKP